MLISTWQTFIPMYFAMNKVNYARYGCYYIHTLVNMEHIYPGLRELLRKNGMSVQAQDHYPHRTSIDQRGEQTINRDAKTSGFNNILFSFYKNTLQCFTNANIVTLVT